MECSCGSQHLPRHRTTHELLSRRIRTRISSGQFRAFGRALQADPSHGHSEVIVETPHHNVTMAISSVEQVKLTVEAMIMRGKALRSSSCARHVTFFKQHKCGSILHAHSQLITTPFVPSNIRRQCVLAREYHEKHKECAACRFSFAIPTNEEAKKRLVFQTKHFVVTVPFAAIESKEIIAPRRRSCDFRLRPRRKWRILVLLYAPLRLYHYRLTTTRGLSNHHVPLRYESDEERHTRNIFTGTPRWENVASLTIRILRRRRRRTPYLPEDDAWILRSWYGELVEKDKLKQEEAEGKDGVWDDILAESGVVCVILES